jgi:hypothetical protein
MSRFVRCEASGCLKNIQVEISTRQSLGEQGRRRILTQTESNALERVLQATKNVTSVV